MDHPGVAFPRELPLFHSRSCTVKRVMQKMKQYTIILFCSQVNRKRGEELVLKQNGGIFALCACVDVTDVGRKWQGLKKELWSQWKVRQFSMDLGCARKNMKVYSVQPLASVHFKCAHLETFQTESASRSFK